MYEFISRRQNARQKYNLKIIKISFKCGDLIFGDSNNMCLCRFRGVLSSLALCENSNKSNLVVLSVSVMMVG